jgi:exosortase sorting signal-containing protein
LKYGPTPLSPLPHWYVLPAAVISGNTATLTITDGGLGDDDLLANGVIVDQGGPATPEAAIPTLSEWAQLTLCGILALLGLVAVRRSSLPRSRDPLYFLSSFPSRTSTAFSSC